MAMTEPGPSSPGRRNIFKEKPWLGPVVGCFGCLGLLVLALPVLGILFAFGVPKVMQSSATAQNAAIAKEAASIISGSFSAYRLNNKIDAVTGPGDLTQFMNYVRVEEEQDYGHGLNCALPETTCLLLHSGAVMAYGVNQQFGSTDDEHRFLIFNVDPDGPRKASPVSFAVFPSGRLTTGGKLEPHEQPGPRGVPVIAEDPDYLIRRD